MSAGDGDVSQLLKSKPSFGDFPPTFHVPTNILTLRIKKNDFYITTFTFLPHDIKI